MADPSPRQLELMTAILSPNVEGPEGPGPNNIVASGPWRAGKSYAGIDAWSQWTTNWRQTKFGVVTASDSRLQATIEEFRDIARRQRMHWAPRKRHIEFGANSLWYWVSSNSLSHKQVQGHTFGGIYGDEGTALFPSCVTQANARCASMPEAKLLWTTNPDTPVHPFRLDLIDKIIAGVRAGAYFEFSVDDNPAMTEAGKREMFESLSEGMMRDRYYWGRWVVAGGSIYPQIESWVRKIPRAATEEPMRCFVTADTAEVGVTHALLIGSYSNNRHWVLAEWRHDGRTDGPMPKAEQAAAIARLGSTAPVPVSEWMSDPADEPAIDALRVEVSEQGLPGIVLTPEQQPKPSLMESIRAVNAAGNTGRLFVAPHCGLLLDELRGLKYDEAKLSYGIEKPTEGDDHGADALRYWVWRSGIWRGSAWA